MTKIILATTSPYRIAAFKELSLDFISEGSDVDEKFINRPTKPQELVLTLAQLKAENVAKNHQEGIVIGFDSVGYFQGQILEKPQSVAEGRERLIKLSGQKYFFYTGVWLINLDNQRVISRAVETEIDMRQLSEAEIDKYIAQDPNFKTYAHGYDPVGHYSSTFALKLVGSYNNFSLGIPLEAIAEMLIETGYKITK
ncbi:MAG: Maf family protein [Patescibacteria group bacterium]